MKKVLILDGDAAHALAIIECLRASGYQTAVLCNGTTNYGYHSRYANEKYLAPDSHNTHKYFEFLTRFLDEHHFDVLIPTSDATALCMSTYREELSKKTGVLMPGPEVFMRGYDKNQLMALCREKGYPHPLTVDVSKTAPGFDDLKEFPYPALIKPNLTSGGRGMTLVNSYEEFISAYPAIHQQYGECHLQQYIPQGGKQIKVQIFVDRDGSMKNCSVIWKQRYYPVNGGSSSCNVTVENPEVVKVCASVLKDIEWEGFADFDLIEDSQTGELLIMEINPRIPACIRSAFKSGMDFATMIADATLSQPLREYTYTPGKALRHLGFEILWFLKSPNRFKTYPNWFKFFGKNIYYQDWLRGNFSSFFWGTWGNFKKQMNPEFRKAKSGVQYIDIEQVNRGGVMCVEFSIPYGLILMAA